MQGSMTIRLEAIMDDYVKEQLTEFIRDEIKETTGDRVDAFDCNIEVDYELDTSEDGNELEDD